MDLDNTTNLSCIKILIRLARTNSETAERIVSHSSLMNGLMRQFERMGSVGDRKASLLFHFTFEIQIFIYYLNVIGTYSRLQKLQAFTLKLFRVLCTHGKRLIDQLYVFGLRSVLKSAVFVHDNSITVSASAY